MSTFAVSIRRPDLLDDECGVCGWSRWMGLCGCAPPGEVRQSSAEDGEPEIYSDPCGHRRGACSCEADDMAFFADEEL
ncbi:MAG: hypothetical protein HY873_13225 [Chloroflexi bacterium]|nr:hypothetical protein [Chloroflexota bacterium]